MNLPLCSVVITAYNSAGDLPGCLDGLLAQDYPAFEIILVDNASTDNTQTVVERYLKQHGERIRCRRLPVNRAITGGYNAGAEIAQGEILLFINADTVPQPGWLSALAEPLRRDPRIGLTTSRILLFDAPDRVNTCGNSLTWTGLTVCRGFGEPAEQWREAGEVVAVSGAAFAIRRSLFEQIGGFDETFEFYLDDTDLSLRALLAGYTAWFVPDSLILHKYTFKFGASKAFYIERNRWLTMLKALRLPTLLILLPGLILGDLIAWVYAAMQGPEHLQAKAASWRWLWANRRMIGELRRRTQAARRVRDRDVLRAFSSELRFTGTVSDKTARFLGRTVKPLLQTYGTVCRALALW
ncbi:MAG TPA: glycosyltransferase family 2 protein [Caldilineaceae bacterium]|nr:glycosyltransferase family 2 protein [Caldilineaceae bacterium]